jgi:chlorobactene glucosyltransferase
MPLLAASPLLALIALALCGGAYYAVMIARILRTRRDVPTVRRGLSLPLPEPPPNVCLVIPAHNEEPVIATLARSIMRQDYPALSIVFALDRCTDRTDAIVRESCASRAEIVTVDRCPEGWAGKTHAAWRGVQDSRAARHADMLLFADADTEFDPGLVRAAVAIALERRLDLLSLLSRLTLDHGFEKFVQPAAGLELVRQYPLDIVNRRERPRAFANGQFMLFRRELYDSIGGHELVKHELLEDIAFARHLDRVKKSRASRWGVLMSDGMLRCRMYRDWHAFRRGWKRIYTEASLRRPAQLREWARRKRLTGVAMPFASILCLLAAPIVFAWGDRPLAASLLAAGLLSSTLTALALAMVYRDQGVPLRFALAYPCGAWRVASLLAEAAQDLDRGVRTIWAGREYTRQPQT